MSMRGIALYEGEVFSGLANGNGKLILRDGSWIEAYWEKGKKIKSEKAYWIYDNGYYIGEVKSEKENIHQGKGTYVWSDGG